MKREGAVALLLLELEKASLFGRERCLFSILDHADCLDVAEREREKEKGGMGDSDR